MSANRLHYDNEINNAHNKIRKKIVGDYKFRNTEEDKLWGNAVFKNWE
jgi:hypothetical protein